MWQQQTTSSGVDLNDPAGQRKLRFQIASRVCSGPEHDTCVLEDSNLLSDTVMM